jgi:hypothetical protein
MRGFVNSLVHFPDAGMWVDSYKPALTETEE